MIFSTMEKDDRVGYLCSCFAIPFRKILVETAICEFKDLFSNKKEFFIIQLFDSYSRKPPLKMETNF